MAEPQLKKTSQQETTSPQTSQGSQVTRTPQSEVSRRMPDPFSMTPRDFFSASPFALMRRMSDEMDRIFGEFGRGPGEARGWTPAIDVAEREGKYIVHAELPGLKPEDVKVELTDDAIVIQGERKFEHEESKGGMHRSERRYGQFYRSIPLPQGVKADEVQANFENGVLEVTAPLPPQQVNRRQIPVRSATTGSPTQAT